MKNLFSEPLAKVSSQVHTTTDYFMFKPLDGNRQKNALHLNRLKNSMMENYLFTIITVNEAYEIIDGQHRFEIIKELKLPLNYVICNGYGLPEVQRLNANSKTWSTDDFLEAYCDLGKSDYINYRQFKEDSGLDHKSCMALLDYDNGVAYKQFANGNFKISNLSEAKRKAELINLIRPFYSGYKRTIFVRCMLQLFNKPQFSFTEFIQKLSIQPSALQDCTNVSQYLSLIEEIYNYKRREKVNLRY
jgi:hypothetical protein